LDARGRQQRGRAVSLGAIERVIRSWPARSTALITKKGP
jgi:hypothetical protein